MVLLTATLLTLTKEFKGIITKIESA